MRCRRSWTWDRNPQSMSSDIARLCGNVADQQGAPRSAVVIARVGMAARQGRSIRRSETAKAVHQHHGQEQQVPRHERRPEETLRPQGVTVPFLAIQPRRYAAQQPNGSRPVNDPCDPPLWDAIGVHRCTSHCPNNGPYGIRVTTAVPGGLQGRTEAAEPPFPTRKSLLRPCGQLPTRTVAPTQAGPPGALPRSLLRPAPPARQAAPPEPRTSDAGPATSAR